MKTRNIALLSLAAILAATVHAAPTVKSGSIVANETWSPALSPDGYILDGLVFVTAGATLDIAPGTIIRGQPKTTTGSFDPGSLIVTRTGKIQARGTASNPIIFTTAALDAGKVATGGVTASGEVYDGPDADTVPDKWSGQPISYFLDATPAATPLAPISPAGVRNSSLWGGLVIAGNSRTNASQDVTLPSDGVKDDGYGFIEGLTSIPEGIYGGGTNPDLLDNSGIVKYVSIRHGGFELAATREINGLTLYAVGAGTTIDHIDVYCNSDDGVEVFGGTVNLSYLNINFCEDDGFDADQGHSGTVQFVYVAHGIQLQAAPLVLAVSSSDPRGMELDGDDANESGAPIIASGLPRQNTRIYNATVQTNGQRGVVMRRGFGGALINSIIAQGGAVAETGIEITSANVAPSIAATTRYSTQALQIRNTTINGYTTPSSTFVESAVTYTPHTNTGFATSVFFPATGNQTATADMLAPTYANGGLNPRYGAGPGSPNGLATGGAQDITYVVAPALFTAYRGAFLGTATTLWTTGWTAANKTNTAGIKVLVD